MNLKAQFEKDLDVFVNLNEFADLHFINGQTVPAIINSSTFEDIDRETVQALFTSTLRVCVKQGSLNRLPQTNEEVELDGMHYNCLSTEVKQGCDVLVLEANAH